MASPDVLEPEELEGESPDVLEPEQLKSAVKEPSFARQVGRALTSPTGRGAEIGGVIGAAAGMPTVGAAIGAGVGKLFGEPAVREKVKSFAAEARAAKPVAPTPAKTAQDLEFEALWRSTERAVQEEEAQKRALEERQRQWEIATRAKTGQRAGPPEPKPEVAKPAEPVAPAKDSPEDRGYKGYELPYDEVAAWREARQLRYSTYGDEPELGYTNDQIKKEIEQNKKADPTYTPWKEWQSEVDKKVEEEKQPSIGDIERRSAILPKAFAQRGTGTVKGLLKTVVGETPGAYWLEEPDVPDPDLPRPESESKAKLWDKMQETVRDPVTNKYKPNPEFDKFARDAARLKWKGVYESRKSRGTFKYGWNLPYFETPTDEATRKKFFEYTIKMLREGREHMAEEAARKGLPEPTYTKTVEEQALEMAPFDLEEKPWQPTELEPLGVARYQQQLRYPVPGKTPTPPERVRGLTAELGAKAKGFWPERMKPSAEEAKKEEEEEDVGTGLMAAPRFIRNVGIDLVKNIAGFAQMLWAPIGSMPVPETPRVLAARDLLKKAKETGDKKKIEAAEEWLDKVSQEEIGHQLGAGIGSMPAQIAGLAEGATNMSRSNTILRKPVSFLVMVLLPLESAIKSGKIPLIPEKVRQTGIIKPVTKSVGFLVGTTFDLLGRGLNKVTFNKLKGLKGWLVQHLTDALHTGDKARTEILDDLATGRPEGIEGISQLLTSRLSTVEGLTETELQEVELAFRPGQNVEAAKAATRAATKATGRAVTMADIKAKSAETAELVGKLSKDIKDLKRQAKQTQSSIAKAATEADRAKLRKALNELQQEQARKQARLDAELRESRLRGKAKIAGEAAMERGVGLAEELQPMGKVTRGMQKKLEILDYKPEDIKKMNFAQAKEILERAGERVSVRAEPRTMMTKSMREQLNQLGYTNQMIEKWEPAYAEQVLREAAEKTKEPKVVSFVSENGDRYTVDQNGVATKTKFGEPGVGPKEPKVTFYVSKEDAAKLQEIKSREKKGKLVYAKVPDQPNAYGIKYTKGPNKGKFVPESIIQRSAEPRVGLTPVEISEEGKIGVVGSPILDVAKETKITAPVPVSRLAAKAGKDVIRLMAEMERELSAADEARQRGIQQEDVLRERQEQVRAKLEEQERDKASKAAVAGVEMAEGVKGLEGEEAAAQAARRAAAAPGRLEAGARRAAETAAREELTAGERPEVSLGRIYVPKEKLTIKQVGETDLVEAVQKATDKANTTSTPENWAEVARAQKELDIYQELAKEPQIKESDFRVKVEQAQDAVDVASDARRQNAKKFSEAISKWNEGKIERQEFNQIEQEYRASEDALTKANENLAEAQVRRDVARKADLPGKVSELISVDKRSITQLNQMLERAKANATDVLERYQSASPEERLTIKPELNEARAMVDRLERAIKTGTTGELRAFTEEHPDLARMFAEVPARRRFIIEEAATKASDYKKQALDAGFNPEAPVKPEVAKQLGVPEGTSLYKAARKYAEHVQDLGAEPGLVSEFLQDQGVKKYTAEKAGRWLNAEIEAQSAATGMIEPAYGVARRPAAVLEQYEVTPEGRVVERKKAMEEALARAARPLAEGEKPEVGAYGDMKRILREMSEYETVREKPKSFTTSNKEYNKLLRDYAEHVADISGYGERQVNPRFDLEIPDGELQAGDINKWAKRAIDDGRKIITPERIQLRALEPLFDMTTQLAVRSEKFRAQVLKQVKERLDATDLSTGAKYEVIKRANELITDPKRMSDHGKNNYPVIKYGDVDLLTPQDFLTATQKIAPKALIKARSEAVQGILQQHNKSAALYSMMHGIESEMNRFRFDGKGQPLVSDVSGEPVAIENREGYASQLAQDVVRKGEAPPLVMPHEGKNIAESLLSIAYDPKYNWSKEEVAKIKELAEDVKNFKSAGDVTTVLNRVQEKVFQGTDNKPTDMHNVHMHPAVLRAMKDYFSSLESDMIGNAVLKEMTVLGKKAQKSVVPLSVGSLVTNDFSNSLHQTIKRGSFNWLPEALRENFAHYKFLNGDYRGMSQADLLKRQSIAKHAPIGHVDHLKAVSESAAFKAMSEKLGLKGVEANLQASNYDWLLKPGEANQAMRDFMVEGYSKYGDTFFRLGEMGRIWDDLSIKVWDKLQPNQNIEVPVSRNRFVRITNMGNEKYMIEDMSAAKQPSIIVGKYSPELSDVFAKAAYVAQNASFLDPRNLGLWGKSLKRGFASVFSGIFTWNMGATDIPFLKKGLVHNLLFGEPEYRTNSPEIMQMQANEFWGRSFRRAMMLGSAQAAFKDQDNLRELRRSIGFDPGMEATIVAKASNPAYVMSRSLDSSMFVSPTVNASNAISGLAYWLEFSPVFNKPEFFAQVMTVDRDWTEEDVEQLKQSNPKMAEFAQSMIKMKKEDPEAYRNRLLMKRDYIRYSHGETATPEKVAKTVGLSGGPALTWIVNAFNEKWTGSTLARKMGEMVFGVTPFRTADFAAGMAGYAGAESVGSFSTYGEKLSKAGFYDGSGKQPTLQDMAELYARNAFGVGWETAFYGNGNESPDDPRGFGRLKSYAKDLKNDLDKQYDEQIKKLKKPPSYNVSDEERKRRDQELVAAQILKSAIDEEYNKTINNLNQQLEALNKSRQAYPAPQE